MTTIVLVPVDLPQEDDVPEVIIDLLAETTVVPAGIYEVPTQTALSQAKQHDDGRAADVIDDLAARFRDAGATVKPKIRYTHTREQTVDKLRSDEACDVILVPKYTERIEWLLVPIRGVVNIDRITTFITSLSLEGLQRVTLFHVAPSESKRSHGQATLNYVTDVLVSSKVPEEKITSETVVGSDPIDPIVERAKNHDAIVMGGTKPSLTERIFGRIPNRIGQRAGCPVFVITPKE
ncbi:universal stress protein [Halobacteria archaeon AArc-m2/3/4]|uniref:Universal stress protein n=1 Tax=Natronoglomus mannanivorans TaxID=2979990 RepID=A0AAP2Z0J4_9EURY|nr:universal stress protein [Halobacteria archaeon AArc-xg1-1]MCU4975890.1 universal stress protein [Halobacteria archaeon AArc-m2/3/4]